MKLFYICPLPILLSLVGCMGTKSTYNTSWEKVTKVDPMYDTLISYQIHSVNSPDMYLFGLKRADGIAWTFQVVDDVVVEYREDELNSVRIRCDRGEITDVRFKSQFEFYRLWFPPEVEQDLMKAHEILIEVELQSNGLHTFVFSPTNTLNEVK